ncbi:ABC transporter permease subunit [Gammaproteobacteria bacterium]|nr:ABC transporter permease subunit [Gammaproteobacteria bacterium]
MAARDRPIIYTAARKPSWTLWGGAGASLALFCLAAGMFWALWTVGREQGVSAPDVTQIGAVLWFTLFQAAASTTLSLALGLAVAWSLAHQRRFPGRRQLIALMSLSMVLPTLVVVLGLITVLGRQGWLNQLLGGIGAPGIGGAIYGLGGILTAHVFLNAPFVARLLLQRLDAVPVEKLKLGRSLGLSPWQRFRFMEWPALASSLPGLCATVFLLCFTSFAVVLTLGGSPRFNTLEVAIYEAIKLEFDIRQAVALSLIQLGVCGALVVAASIFRSQDRSLSVVAERIPWPETAPVRLLQLSVISIFTLVYTAPLLAVLTDGLPADFAVLLSQPVFVRALMTSLILAALSSAITLAIALLISGAKHRLASPLHTTQTRLVHFLTSLLTVSGTIYLAIPSLVMALGFFLIARNLASDVYLLAPVALLLANVLMSLPFALIIIYPALHKAGLKHDRVAISLGLSGFPRWRWIDFPAIRTEIGFVAALSFCFSFGDLGVISVFGNRDFSTLPWLLYQKMGSYRTTEAAGIALILLVMTFVVFFTVPRFIEGKRDA